jgi:hypothetical protein
MNVISGKVEGEGVARDPWYSCANLLFGIGLALYLLTRLWHIEDFPIFFFCDEAYHQNEIWKILGRGLRGADGTFLPLFVEKAPNRWVPQITLYLYLLPTIVFGKSILITRGLLAILTVCAPIGCAMTTRVLGFRRWWLAPFVLSAIPTWLLHSRTAFETTLVPSFFACFLGWYVLYLQGRPRALAVAAFFGGLAIYSHFSGTIVIFSAVALFAVVHVTYHVRHMRQVLLAVLLGVFFLVPLIRFKLNLPVAAEKQLAVIDSDWVNPHLSLNQKIEGALSRYRESLDPRYWFSTQEAAKEIERHRWGNEAHMVLWTAPLFLLGTLVLLPRLRRREASAVMIALLVSVAPSLVVGVGVMRVFSYVVPVTIFTVIGIDFLLSLVERLRPALASIVAVVVAMTFSGQSLILTRDALAQGPTWFDQYGLYGMQFGARQLFTKIGEVLKRYPEMRVRYSVDWANNAHEFPEFFLAPSELSRLSATSSHNITQSKDVEKTKDIFALSAQDYDRVVKTGLFSDVTVHDVIAFPDGRPGFFFVTLTYRSDADEIIEREDRERRKPVDAEVDLQGQKIKVLHSKLDLGSIQNVLDNDDNSLARGLISNPFLLEISYTTPVPAKGMTLNLGGLFFRVSAEVVDDQGKKVSIEREFDTRSGGNTTVAFSFAPTPMRVSTISMKLLDINAGSEGHVHVREFRLTE